MDYLTPQRSGLADRHRPDPRGLRLLFVTYLVLLIWIVVWKLDVPFIGTGSLRHIKLVPFAASGADSASDPFEVGVNVLLFLPFGGYLGLLAPRWPIWRSVAVLAGASLALETSQYALAVGSSDSTDVIVNTIGGLVGLALLHLVRRRLRGRTSAVMARVCSIASVVAILACVAFFVSPLQYRQFDDAGPLGRGTARPTWPTRAAGSAGEHGRRDSIDRGVAQGGTPPPAFARAEIML